MVSAYSQILMNPFASTSASAPMDNFVLSCDSSDDEFVAPTIASSI